MFIVFCNTCFFIYICCCTFIVVSTFRYCTCISNVCFSRYSILEQGLEIEAQKANQARISEQRSKSELHEKNRELDEVDFAHNTAKKEMKKEFQHQMQTMRIEIINQHYRFI